jgi:peptidoglycan hydrolase-like protein with peptidoglycan-binding domain
MAGAVSSGSAVRWAQTCLSFLGYYSGSLHGEYDEATRAAVRLFNEDNGFPGLDDLSLGSARALMEAYYYNRGDLGKL